MMEDDDEMMEVVEKKDRIIQKKNEEKCKRSGIFTGYTFYLSEGVRNMR